VRVVDAATAVGQFPDFPGMEHMERHGLPVEMHFESGIFARPLQRVAEGGNGITLKPPIWSGHLSP